MEPLQNADVFGPPSVEVAGLRVWIHDRQFPWAQDYWDGNWLNITACCQAPGAVVWMSGAVLMVPDIARWCVECERLYERLEGTATLHSCEPELHVEIRARDRAGHLTMEVGITPEFGVQWHEFEFGLDQSYLPSIVAQCRRLLAEYPVRGSR